MKKTGLFVIFPFLLFSCDFSAQKYVKISNNSLYEVTFRLKGYNGGTYTLPPGESDDFKPEMSLESFTASPSRVSFRENSEVEWEFYDTLPITLNIHNTLLVPVELSARGGIDNEPLTILPGLTEDIPIYTFLPEFTARVDKFPVDTNFVFDESENAIYLRLFQN
jgi:hypothetical protein